MIAKMAGTPTNPETRIILRLPYSCDAHLESPLYLAFWPKENPNDITLFKMDPDHPKFLSFKPKQTKIRPIITGRYLVQWIGKSNLYEIVDLDYLFSVNN